MKDHKQCRRRAIELVHQLGYIHSKLRNYVADYCGTSGLTQCVYELDELLIAVDKLRRKLALTNGRGK
jgi:hypothetical protein